MEVAKKPRKAKGEAASAASAATAKAATSSAWLEMEKKLREEFWEIMANPLTSEERRQHEEELEMAFQGVGSWEQFRDNWFYESVTPFDAITEIPCMHFTDANEWKNPDIWYRLTPLDTLQIVSVQVKALTGADWPLDVYGFIAVHDKADHRRNMVFDCKREDCQTINEQKALLLIECNQEIEKVKQKYASLLQKEDSAHLQAQRDLADIYRKVAVHTSLAENFRREMTPSAAAQGRSARPVMEQPSEPSSAAETAASPATSSSAVRPPVRNPPGSHVRPSFVAQSSSPSWNAQQQAILYANFYGTTSSPFVSAPVPYGSYGSAGAQSRAVQPLSALASNLYTTMSLVPPTHLPHGSDSSAGAQLHASARLVQQLRMPRPYAVHAEQQQEAAASPGVASLGQYVPVIMGNCASSLGSTSGPPNAAPGSQLQAGAQIAGSSSESASLSTYLPARLGLGSRQGRLKKLKLCAFPTMNRSDAAVPV